MNPNVYAFGGPLRLAQGERANADPRTRDKTIVGGKGANLAEMAGIGLPVPPGFSITTEVCTAFNASNGQFDDALRGEVAAGIAHIERVTGKRFGDPDGSGEGPLLVSVRSGARVSMPGKIGRAHV